MNALKCLALAAVVAAAYFAGARSTVTEAAPVRIEEPKLVASPADVTVSNPTAVLLGEASVPPEMLRGPATPAPDLIVPELPK